MIFKRTKHIDPRREWIRRVCPDGKNGFIFEDLDGVIRILPGRGFANKRSIKLVEHKWNVTQIGYAQTQTFLELDAALRSNPYYLGFYLVTYPGIATSPDDDEYVIDFKRSPRVNGKELSWDELKLFYLGELELPKYFR